MRVLVVDDERHIVRLIRVNLQRQGHAVTCAQGGREAIRLLEREAFDLAVIDGEMAELLAWIRGNKATKDLRVVMMGGDGLPDHPLGPSGGPTAGANLWLTKPF